MRAKPVCGDILINVLSVCGNLPSYKHIYTQYPLFRHCSFVYSTIHNPCSLIPSNASSANVGRYKIAHSTTTTKKNTETLLVVVVMDSRHTNTIVATRARPPRHPSGAINIHRFSRELHIHTHLHAAIAWKHQHDQKWWWWLLFCVCVLLICCNHAVCLCNSCKQVLYLYIYI